MPGVSTYRAVQICGATSVHDLVEGASEKFYEQLFLRLRHQDQRIDVDALRSELQRQRSGQGGRLRYLCQPDFDIAAAMNGDRVDIFFSQAAFEHFDDVNRAVRQMTEVASEDAVAIISIDLQTHSRWIRDKDPNNIYRYPRWLYRLFRFKGIPNRVRPFEYKTIFENNGWHDIIVRPFTRLPGHGSEASFEYLARPYRDDRAEMEHLTILLCARNGGFKVADKRYLER